VGSAIRRPGVRLSALWPGVVLSDNRYMPRTVLIVDDHPSFRTSARLVLEDAGYQVVGEANDGRTALAAARELRPAIVLLDVQLPDLDGFEVARLLTADQRVAPAVVLTSSRDGTDFAGMIGLSGARGFIAKDELSGPLLEELLR
jgi:DNA-binding NarL/FixJ family response regulator